MKFTILPVSSDTKPEYTLTINYMMGAAEGDYFKSRTFTKITPEIERAIEILKNIEDKNWNGGLCENDLWAAARKGIISEGDVEFLVKWDDNYSERLLMSDIGGEADIDGYSYLSFQRFELTYIDETGLIHKVEIER